MTVTYCDSIGVVSVQIDEEYGVVFDNGRAYFTDGNDNNYNIAIGHLISIVKEQ